MNIILIVSQVYDTKDKIILLNKLERFKVGKNIVPYLQYILGNLCIPCVL